MSTIDLLYPKRCPVCLDVLPPGDRLICEPCRKKLKVSDGPACYRCGRPLKDEWQEYCSRCEKQKPEFEEGIVWADYASLPVRRMLSQVKYHGDPQLLDYPCLDLAERRKERALEWKAEVLIPVPVHKSRLKSRGYNQASEIAERLSEIWKIPVDDTYLVREHKTRAQKTLSRSGRADNLMNAFSVSGERNRYRRVILVDDIYTTGATAAACTRALKRSGVQQVFLAVLASGQG